MNQNPKTPIYNHQVVEEKWQKSWEEKKLFQDSLAGDLGEIDPEKKALLLFAFAYPSGSGLHVGHVESKTALDILARTQRMQGKHVFFPVGWDAFGLPAENYAIKTGIHPVETTKNAINTFRRQIKRIGISYDWANELATNHPEYYRWTQWLFLQLYKKGLAYQKDGMVNWCPSCQTVLANEQVVDGLCERCDAEVVQKQLKQWYFKITDYKEELISGLDEVDWPHATKQQQLNWIGKKEGINIHYKVVDVDGVETGEEVVCFTTRPDTNFGATFVVLAPEHGLVEKIMTSEVAIKGKGDSVAGKIQEYFDKSQKKTELERQQEGRNKSGVFTGLYALNQLTGRKMPIWVSDFVLGGFGTGAVVGVPGHDERDFEFVQYVNEKYPEMAINVVRVVVGADGDKSEIVAIDQVQEESGTMINSEFLNGLDIHEATQKMMDHLEEKGWGERVVSYKLRDWLISRQRYWGAPIPVVYDLEGNSHPVKEEHLPWVLPTDVDFKPSGESPLRSSREFVERTERLYGKGWRPEFDTMDTFVDSSWYYLRYCDSRNTEEFARKERVNSWLPVDLYLIGPEHIVLHLLYSRFFTKFLRDEGYLNFGEPFGKMRHQGMILGPDGKKMSKSKGNVINPDEIIEKYGADTLRVYEMFMGPLEADKPWSTTAVAGVSRFLTKIYKLGMMCISGDKTISSQELQKKLNQTIKKVGEDTKALKFNTAIAMMMEFVNLWSLERSISKSDLMLFVKILAPYAPFLAEELYFSLGGDGSVHLQSWPEYDESLVIEEKVTVVVQVNGKVRGQVEIASVDLENRGMIFEMARSEESVIKWIDGKKIVKEIYVPGKIVSFVVN